MTETPEDIIRFWTEDVGEAGWYGQSDATDAAIRDRFLTLWQQACDTDTPPFTGDARADIASLIVLDQFPRNLFRDDPRAFATDPLARRTARTAIAADRDLQIDRPLRQFFYTPFLHSEDPADQDEALRVIERGMGRNPNYRHALAHGEIIRRFGRFPFRNAALGRETTAEEREFLENGGYSAILESIEI